MSTRIVSLSPALSEIIVALGYGDQLVARGQDCNYPEQVSRLPLFDKDTTADLIFTDAEHPVDATETRVVMLEAEDMGDVWNHIREVARLLGDEEKGHHLVFKLQQRQASVAAGALDAPAGVICLDEINPLQAAGRWMPELIEMASGDNLMGLMGEASQVLSPEELMAAQPEILIISPRGQTLEEIENNMPQLTALAGWGDLPAVKKKQVYLADSQGYLGRPGPRLVEALEMLGEMLHPETFDFGHENMLWKRFQD